MFRFITETYHRLIENLNITQNRYLYSSFNLRNRLTGLIGPQGVGKTRLLLQYIKNELFKEKKSFYFSADLIYFQQTTLLTFVSDLHLTEINVIIENKDFRVESVKKYHFKNETGFSDILHLEKETLQKVLKVLSAQFQEIEKIKPALGYELHLIKRGNTRPFEIFIEAIGKRELFFEMEMPVLKECIFCRSVKENIQMEKVAQKIESLSRILRSLEGNPLPISKEHKTHWFNLDLDEQVAMIESIKKILAVYRENSSTYHLKTHVGVKGHQKVPHAHLHVLTGISDY